MVSIGPEEIRNPDDVVGIQKLVVDFVGTAMVVKNRYNPEYHFLPSYQENHILNIPLQEDQNYEYLIGCNQQSIDQSKIVKKNLDMAYQQLSLSIESLGDTDRNPRSAENGVLRQVRSRDWNSGFYFQVYQGMKPLQDVLKDNTVISLSII
jgi:hypothetical protein